MADVKSEQEPSIEEILESIRQIISDDTETPAPAAAAPQPEPAKPAPVRAPEPVPAPAPEPVAAVDNVVDLTDIIEEPAFEIDMQDSVSTYQPAVDLSVSAEDDSLLSDAASAASAEAMARLLAGNVAVERDEVGRVGRITLEDMARELMRPLIKSWLDQNMPKIIERVVAREVEKISRRALGQ